jgi:hypothetical protein
MNKKEIIKYLEIVFKDIANFESVSINNPIAKVLKHETKSERIKFFLVVDNVELFAINNDLIEKNGDGGWFKLTPTGKDFKRSNLSYCRYKLKLKIHSFNIKKIGLIVAVIALILSIVWRCEDNHKRESPKPESVLVNDSLSEKPYNKNGNKLLPLKDTLKTKKAVY